MESSWDLFASKGVALDRIVLHFQLSFPPHSMMPMPTASLFPAVLRRVNLGVLLLVSLATNYPPPFVDDQVKNK